MIARTGKCGAGACPSRISSLANYRLVFQSLTPDGPAFANVLSPGDGVLGVVYRCNSADLQRLDTYEQGYQRRLIQVTDCQGAVLQAEAYVLSPPAAAGVGRPSADYLKTIVDGARRHGLPENYIRNILTIAATRLT
jgi:gamma-glutamylcyclotransferase (GGCT)/AIG2-like uncharacterized protein YtfP